MATAPTGAYGTQQATPRTPAYMANNPQAGTMNNTDTANLDMFANPVQGNTDTGVSHDGDLGGAG